MQASNIEERFPFVQLLLICVLAIWIRIPGINAGMPYFYAEDEAHHFNRTVEMVKEGRYDPQYFHKPSLHFYLRMPIVALSYLWGKKHGYLNSVQDIETRNSFGLAGYAFTASHPGIVKWNRAFSVLLSLLTIIFTFLLCREVTGNTFAPLAAALLLAISPEFLINSPIIGVDILMALMCVVSAYVALRVYRKFSLVGLGVVGILCGLAVSSKYNALPIAALPLAVCFATHKLTARNIAVAFLTPAVGFFLGSPYILVSIPLFIDHLSYEIWHYGVAGHEGHSAQPGIEQASFYARWLVTDGLGWMACLSAILGLNLLRSEKKREAALFLIYPALFAALMIGQKANFTRNMVSLLPFVAILGAAGLSQIVYSVKIRESIRPALFWILLAIFCLQPLIRSLTYARDLREQPESRRHAAGWLVANSSQEHNTAISGELQFQTPLYRLPGNSRIDSSKPIALSIYQAGFDRLIVGPEYPEVQEDASLLNLIKMFPGDDAIQRIAKNPRISIYEVIKDKAAKTLEEKYTNGSLTEGYTVSLTSNDDASFSCSNSRGETYLTPSENYCWIQSRFAVLSFHPNAALPKATTGILSLTLMSPWKNQTLKLRTKNWSHEVDLSKHVSGEWQKISIPVSAENLRDPAGILLEISEVHAPASQKLSTDSRRLGIAIKSAQFQ